MASACAFDNRVYGLKLAVYTFLQSSGSLPEFLSSRFFCEF
jgi:hypothetical protein